MALKVMMMGGRRCGKTSALASLFEQATNGPVRNYFTVADKTQLETKDMEVQDSLSNKTLELKHLLQVNQANSNIFLVDNNPTNYFWTYNLHLQIPGTHREMDIEFRDCAGEVFEPSSRFAQETAQYINESDVFVIVIDTPYLMGPIENDTQNICPDSINLGTNRVADIQNFLTNINDNDGTDAKMVVFVPLKCEKWAKQPGGLERVKQRVKEVYSTHIQNLSAYQKMNISIIPMQTSGNILFVEFRDAYLFNGIDGIKRCCKISDDLIRTEDGENHIPIHGETILPDPLSIINGTTLKKPYSWFQINPTDNSYAPKNCEQLPLHIIRFMLEKLMDVENNINRNNSNNDDNGGSLIGRFFQNIIQILFNVRKKVRNSINTMDPQELRDIIIRMQRDGIIKNSGDGIEILKKI